MYIYYTVMILDTIRNTSFENVKATLYGVLDTIPLHKYNCTDLQTQPYLFES